MKSWLKFHLFGISKYINFNLVVINKMFFPLIDWSAFFIDQIQSLCQTELELESEQRA